MQKEKVSRQCLMKDSQKNLFDEADLIHPWEGDDDRLVESEAAV